MRQGIIVSDFLVGNEYISMDAELEAVFINQLANIPIYATITQKALSQNI